jgi:hypothetical protein
VVFLIAWLAGLATVNATRLGLLSMAAHGRYAALSDIAAAEPLTLRG